MKVVIACAGSKDPGAGRLTVSGKKIVFVANPECYPARQGERAVRPDDKWCDELRGYQEGKNPCGLYRAADLYTPNEPFCGLYRDLVAAFECKNVFLLSGGWGLIRADFLTPYYESTFSTSRDIKEKMPWACRDGSVETWPNFDYLQNAQITQNEPIHFFGGFDYLKVYCCLTKHLPGKKVVHYNSVKVDPDRLRRDGFVPEDYGRPKERQNWYYRAAKDFAADYVRRREGS